MTDTLKFPSFNVYKKNEIDNPLIHYLHLGKNAGTQIGNIIDQVNNLYNNKVIHKYGHEKILVDLPFQSKYFFSIRDPISRFISGFYSRKRKGQPRIYVEWTKHEKFAFENFKDANDLAENLYEKGSNGDKAIQAILSIRHTARNQVDWFVRAGGFLELQPPIYIVRVEHFEEDILAFLDKSGFGQLKSKITISKDIKIAHSNNYSEVPALSDKAKNNLKNWYQQDILFYEMCENWIKTNNN